MLSHQAQVNYCRDAVTAMELLEHADAFVAAIDDFEGLDSDPENDGGDPNDPDDAGIDFEDLMDDFLAAVPSSNPIPHPSPPDAPQPAAPTRRTEPHVSSSETYANAGRVVREDTPILESWAKKHGHADNPYFPFKNKVEWDIGRWAKMEGPGASAFDRLLGFDSVGLALSSQSISSPLILPQVAEKLGLSFKTTKKLNQIIDHELAPAPDWHTLSFPMEGIRGEIEVLYRDPMDVLQDIYGSPTYCEQMLFAPERHWEDDDRKVRVYNEMNTGNWWWDMQVCHPLSIVDHLSAMTDLSISLG